MDGIKLEQIEIEFLQSNGMKSRPPQSTLGEREIAAITYLSGSLS